MTAPRKTSLSLALILLLFLAALYPVTHGFRALSADTARRIALADAPRPLPDLPMIDAQFRQFPLSGLPGPSGRWTIATLAYTRCIDICRTSASGLAFLQQALQESRLRDRVQLLTLSFDPAFDTPEQLRRYADQLGAQPAHWRFATVTRSSALKPMLDLFDAIVLPDGMGGYDHNAALFLIDGAGRLMRAYDVNQPDLLLDDLLAMEALQ